MRLLSSNRYPLIYPLIHQSGLKSHLTPVHSLMEGNEPGYVFVDDEDLPSAALACPNSGFYFAFGNARNVDFLSLLPQLRAEYYVDKALIFGTTESWWQTLSTHLPQPAPRIGFTFSSEDRVKTVPVLPSGYRILPLDERLLTEWHPGIDPWVIGIWGDTRSFVERSFGFGVVRGGQVISFAAALAIGGGEAEIEVGTVPEEEGRGWATFACSAFIEECMKRGLRPAWTCDKRNAASQRVADKLGFQPVEEIVGYPLDPSDASEA